MRARFRQLRIAILLLVLAGVAADTWLFDRVVRAWGRPLEVVIHPYVVEPTSEVRAYAAQLGPEAFAEIEPFFEREANRYRAMPTPVMRIVVGAAPPLAPPELPADPGVFGAIVYSLRLRWYAFRYGAGADVRLFLLLHARQDGRQLEHSVGISKGRIGVVHAFGAEGAAATNQVVIAHELLHTFGATDKYDASGQPSFPEGYAEPERQPRLPQVRAELMAGRIPIGPTDARIPESLADCVIGAQTAEEAHWTR